MHVSIYLNIITINSVCSNNYFCTHVGLDIIADTSQSLTPSLGTAHLITCFCTLSDAFFQIHKTKMDFFCFSL